MAEPVEKLLEALACGDDVDFAAAPPPLIPLISALRQGASPRHALLALSRLVELRGLSACWPSTESALAACAALLSSGPELPRLLLRRPERLDAVLDRDLSQPASRRQLLQRLNRAIESAQLPEPQADGYLDALAASLASFRNDEFVRLAAREFCAAPLEEVGAELAWVADVCLQRALELVLATHALMHGALRNGADHDDDRCGLVAIAMGKYGAEELNFCSDIDLVFIYDSDEGTAGAQAPHERYSAVCRDIVRVLSQQGDEGFAFRVDLRLRPEGSRGPICNSFASAERYYETWGGPYDRLAWLKARVAAGDAQLGQAMLDLMRPFVFPRTLGPQVIDQIRELSLRIKRELVQHQLGEGWNVKLGAGGIRDIEFFVQALQLLHAGKLTSLQERSTLRALEKLFAAGLIGEGERVALAEAYDLYRRIEHRLQLHGGRQTHLLPAHGELREHVIAHFGYDAPSFNGELARHRAVVSSIYATLGVAEEPDASLVALLAPDYPPTLAARELSRRGFARASWAAEQLRALEEKPWGPFSERASPRLKALAQALLTELAATPDPDAALGHLVDLTLRFGPYEGPWLMLADHPEARRLLCNLFGSSDLLAQLFIAHRELLDELLMAGRASARREAVDLGTELDSRLAQVEDDDPEQHFGVLERFRDEQLLRIGLHDIGGDAGPDDVWRQLTDLAEETLKRSYRLVLAETTRRYGQPRHEDGSPASMAIVGLGKLGGREMSYGSDLDLIFVHSGEGQTDGARSITNDELFARVAQRLIRALTTAFVSTGLYRVDTRLRPSGSKGTLVVSFDGLRHHHQTAQPWERQVLIKARVVAGNLAFGEDVQRWIESYVYSGGLDPSVLRHEISRLRMRMERELAEEGAGELNLKLGRGGLLDAEFIAQYLQLVHGPALPALRTRVTLDALAAAEAAHCLESQTAQRVIDAYRFLRRLEGRLRIVRGRSAERFAAQAERIELVARRLGFRRQGVRSAGEQLLAAYSFHTENLRAAFLSILGEGASDTARCSSAMNSDSDS